jgi:hypothetical protein
MTGSRPLRRQPDRSEVNFWAPSAANFRALEPGELFLFKLHAPRNVIVGGGIFAYANALPCSLAWAVFADGNGAGSAQEMRARIARYRTADPTDRSDFATPGMTGGRPMTDRDRDTMMRMAAFEHVRTLAEARAPDCRGVEARLRVRRPAYPIVNPQRGIFKPQQMRFLLSMNGPFPGCGEKSARSCVRSPRRSA